MKKWVGIVVVLLAIILMIQVATDNPVEGKQETQQTIQASDTSLPKGKNPAPSAEKRDEPSSTEETDNKSIASITEPKNTDPVNTDDGPLGVLFGVVQDQYQRPVADVTIMVDSGSFFEQTDTNRSGAFEVKVPIGVALNLRAQKPGYEDKSGRNLSLSKENRRLEWNVTLPKLDKRKGSGVCRVMVVDENQSPILNASVHAIGKKSTLRIKGLEQGEGLYILEGLRSDESYGLGVSKDNYKSGGLTIKPQAPGDEPELIILKQAFYFLGRVVDPDGNPIQAQVTTFISSKPGIFSSSGHRTNREGYFRFEKDQGYYSLSARHPEYSQAKVDDVFPNGEQLLLKLAPPSKVIGQALDSNTGQPITDFKVRFSVDWGPDFDNLLKEWRAYSDAQGLFLWEPISAGLNLNLEMLADGYNQKKQKITTSVNPETIQVMLDPADVQVHGYVRNPQGQPWPGVTVVMGQEGQYAFYQILNAKLDPKLYKTETNDQGYFAFPAGMKATSIAIVGGGVGLKIWNYIDRTHTFTQPLEVEAEPESVLNGRINKERWSNEATAILELNPSPDRPDAMRLDINSMSVNQDGHFQFRDLPSGLFEVTIREGSKFSVPKLIELQPGEVADLDLGFDEPSFLEGKVYADGNLAADVFVYLADCNQFQIFERKKSDQTGYIRFEIMPGDYHLVMLKKHHRNPCARSNIINVTVTEEVVMQRFDFHGSTHVYGRASLEVDYVELEGTIIDGREFRKSEPLTNGRFDFFDILPGTYTIYVREGPKLTQVGEAFTIHPGENEIDLGELK